MTAAKEQRNRTLDVAKGISIILMTITHLTAFKNHPMIIDFNNDVLLVFKMPLFIMISGYLFSGKHSFKEFTIGKFDGLVKPLITILSVSAVFIGIWWLIQGVDLRAALYNTRMNLGRFYVPLWFPTTLFMALLLLKTLLQVNKINYYYALSLTVGIVFLLTLPTSSGVAMVILKFHAVLYFLIFLIMGYLLKKWNSLEPLLNFRSFLFFTAIFILSILLRKYLNIRLALFHNVFGSFIPTVVAAFSGVIMMINISRWLSKVKYLSSIFIQCSKSSFYILAFSTLLGNEVVYPLTVRFLPLNAFTEMLGFMLTILLCVLVHQAILRTKYLKYLMLPLKSFR